MGRPAKPRAIKDPEVVLYVRLPSNLREALRERAYRERASMVQVISDMIRKRCAEELKAIGA